MRPISPLRGMAHKRGVVLSRLMVGMLTLASVTICAAGTEGHAARRAHGHPRAAFAAVFGAVGENPGRGALRCCGSAPAFSPAPRPASAGGSARAQGIREFPGYGYGGTFSARWLAWQSTMLHRWAP